MTQALDYAKLMNDLAAAPAASDSDVDSNLDLETSRLLLVFAALIKSSDDAELALNAAAAKKLNPIAVLELCLQSFLFAGFPRCINALAAYRSAYGDAGDTTQEVKTSLPNETLKQRGQELFNRIYGKNTDRVLGDLANLHAELPDWILCDAYGKILSRPQLGAKARELAAIVGLMVSGDRRQLSSHMRGALHCGATAAEIMNAVGLAKRFADKKTRADVMTIAARLNLLAD